MIGYLLWTLPVALAAALVGSGRVTSAWAGLAGAGAAVAVALLAAPLPFTPRAAVGAAARGAWLSILVGAVILSGLFFRDAVLGEQAEAAPPTSDPALRRRRLFTTCFLVGPFAEAATGFGVGQVTTVPALTGLGLAPMQVILFGLFSQIMVPWGALANGTVIGAQLSGLASAELGVRTALLMAPLLLCWLMLFWSMARRAGVSGTPLVCAAELLWLAAATSLLVAANAALGPEVAALAALGPLIAARFVLLERPNATRWRAVARTGLPFAFLILGLAGTRAIPALSAWLGAAAAWQPVPAGAVLHPWLHPAAWLIATGLVSALLLGRRSHVGHAVAAAWSRGRRPCAAILCFLVMAQLMSESGMAAGLSAGLRLLLGAAAPVATPLLAGLFGFLTSSGNASNGLLMPSQVALAAGSGVSLGWLAAIQNAAGSAMTMLSPVRLAMGCALVGRPELEWPVYARAWPLAASALLILVAAACLLVFGGRI